MGTLRFFFEKLKQIQDLCDAAVWLHIALFWAGVLSSQALSDMTWWTIHDLVILVHYLIVSWFHNSLSYPS
jgi:hypothetical protein